MAEWTREGQDCERSSSRGTPVQTDITLREVSEGCVACDNGKTHARRGNQVGVPSAARNFNVVQSVLLLRGLAENMAADVDQLSASRWIRSFSCRYLEARTKRDICALWIVSTTKRLGFTLKLEKTDLDEWMAIGVMYKCKQDSDVAPVIARIGQRHTHLPPDFHLPAMPAQDKKTTEANTRALRELLKQPDNKVCADCKRNGACRTAPNYPSLTAYQIHVGPRGICGLYC